MKALKEWKGKEQQVEDGKKNIFWCKEMGMELKGFEIEPWFCYLVAITLPFNEPVWAPVSYLKNRDNNSWLMLLQE